MGMVMLVGSMGWSGVVRRGRHHLCCLILLGNEELDERGGVEDIIL
jgi:hypothetical protein